jgi:hypothetical protein
VACAILAVIYASLFRRLKLRPFAALLWAWGGVFCTPCWFYGTSTFDDILGSVAVILALSAALASRQGQHWTRVVLAGLALGVGFHCKEPLGIFVLPVLAALHCARPERRLRFILQASVAALLAAAVMLYLVYDWYKFPPASRTAHAELMKLYAPFWSGRPDIALMALFSSLGTGVLFYNPAILICCRGLRTWWSTEKLFCTMLLVAITVFVLFISSLTFFKGDPTWGPRYLTPIFAVLWIFAPAGSGHVRRWAVVTALGLSLAVQLSAVCVDPHRLYVERGLPSAFYVSAPQLYFHPGISHLINRPREIAAILSNRDSRAECYTPSLSPTFAFPVLDFVEKGPDAVRKYQVLSGFRFWWASFQYLDPHSRPIELRASVACLTLAATAGFMMQFLGLRRSQC